MPREPTVPSKSAESREEQPMLPLPSISTITMSFGCANFIASSSASPNSSCSSSVAELRGRYALVMQKDMALPFASVYANRTARTRSLGLHSARPVRSHAATAAGARMMETPRRWAPSLFMLMMMWPLLLLMKKPESQLSCPQSTSMRSRSM
jgi:hypothetical protein